MMDSEEDSSSSTLSHYKLPLALLIVGVTFVSAGIYYTVNKTSKGEIKFSSESVASNSATIIVHVSGEVLNPGVYNLPTGARTNDLIAKAGGFTQKADPNFIAKTLNLASVLKDGAKIYIPSKSEIVNVNVAGVGITKSGTININSASLSDLESLPDIGPVRAQKIVDNRPYQNLEELVEKKIISQSTFEKIKLKINLY